MKKYNFIKPIELSYFVFDNTNFRIENTGDKYNVILFLQGNASIYTSRHGITEVGQNQLILLPPHSSYGLKTNEVCEVSIFRFSELNHVICKSYIDTLIQYHRKINFCFEPLRMGEAMINFANEIKEYFHMERPNHLITQYDFLVILSIYYSLKESANMLYPYLEAIENKRIAEIEQITSA